MRRSMTPRGLMLALATVVLLAGGGIAYATGSTATRGSGGDINGCYNQISGQLRIDGACKAGEMTVSWQRDGQPGPPGPAGPAGAPGRDGRDGRDGLNGLNGLSGLNGRDGSAGPAGAPGAPGAMGPVGSTGPAGGPGEQGAAGPAGSPGPAGGNGAQGPAGPQGQPGLPGPTGEPGPQGPQGQAGPAGQPAILALSRVNFQAQHSTDAATGDFVKALDIGPFTKGSPSSTIRAGLSGVGVRATAFFCIWQLRVDDVQQGNQMILIGPSSAASTLDGVFQGLSAGTHTLSVWVDQRDPGSCLFNAGGFGFGAIVEEISS